MQAMWKNWLQTVTKTMIKLNLIWTVNHFGIIIFMCSNWIDFLYTWCIFASNKWIKKYSLKNVVYLKQCLPKRGHLGHLKDAHTANGEIFGVFRAKIWFLRSLLEIVKNYSKSLENFYIGTFLLNFFVPKHMQVAIRSLKEPLVKRWPKVFLRKKNYLNIEYQMHRGEKINVFCSQRDSREWWTSNMFDISHYYVIEYKQIKLFWVTIKQRSYRFVFEAMKNIFRIFWNIRSQHGAEKGLYIFTELQFWHYFTWNYENSILQ